MKHSHDSYIRVYIPVNKLQSSVNLTADSLFEYSENLLKSSDYVLSDEMKKMSEALSSIGEIYKYSANELKNSVETLQHLQAHSLKAMSTRSDYAQSLSQHSIKKKNFEQLKVDLGIVSNSPFDMQRLAKAEDEVYAAERYMKASHEDIMNQIQWIKQEAAKKYSNSLRSICISFKHLFESGLEKIKEIEDLLPLVDETDIEEPIEKRKELEVIRKNMLSLAHPSTNPLQQVQDCKLFGVHLEKVMSRPEEVEDIPIVVKEMIEYIEKNLNVEGIFRIPASTSKMNEYVERADLGMPLNLEDEPIPHNVCGLLKKYLKVLPDSLLTNKLYSSFVSLMEVEEVQRNILVETLYHELPRSHRKLLLRLLQLMRKVVENSTNNKMNQSNIIMVMAPNFHYVEDENPLSMAQRTPQIVFITKVLYDRIDMLEELDLKISETEEIKSDAQRPLPLPPVPKITKTDDTKLFDNQDINYNDQEENEFTLYYNQENDGDPHVDSSLDSSLSKSRRSGYRFRDFNFDQEQLRASFETAEMDNIRGSFENLSEESSNASNTSSAHEDELYIPKSQDSTSSHSPLGHNESLHYRDGVEEIEYQILTPSNHLAVMEDDEVVVESPYYMSGQDIGHVPEFDSDTSSDTPTLEECTPLHCDSPIDFTEYTRERLTSQQNL